MSSRSSLLRTLNEAVTYNDREVSNQQRRGGANFQYCNDIHTSLLNSQRGVVYGSHAVPPDFGRVCPRTHLGGLKWTHSAQQLLEAFLQA